MTSGTRKAVSGAGRIGVVTSARSDFGYYLPVLRILREQLGDVVDVIATGMHLAPGFGMSVKHLSDAGFEPLHCVESLLASDTAEGVGKSIGLGVSGFAQLFSHWRPDILLVHGDRYDMLPPVIAALPWRLPVAHVGGGEITEGVIDDPIRHAITKMSHLHFVETEQARRVVLGLGEEDWRVTVCGAVSIDSIQSTQRMDRRALAERFGVPVDGQFLLCTFHPEAVDVADIIRQTTELLAAIGETGLPCVFTATNADTNGAAILELIERMCAADPRHRLVVNAGLAGYYGMMAEAAAMVGNSSSGIVEAPAFLLPVVNVGGRQTGRPRADNIIDCSPQRQAIAAAIAQAVSPSFRAGLAGMVNPYGDGHAAERLVETLLQLRSDPRLRAKHMQGL